jgi:hypothetical protein
VVGTVVRRGRETSNSEAKHFHLIMRHLYACKLKFVTPHEESTKNKLWMEKDFTHTCSREWLTEKAARIENNLSERARKRGPWFPTNHVLLNRVWDRRPDGIVTRRIHQTLSIL